MTDLLECTGWSEEILARIQRDKRKFHGHALSGILYAFAKVRVGSLEFWDDLLTYLSHVCLPNGDLWTMERYSSLSLVLIPEIVQSTGGMRFFDAVSETCENHQSWTPRAVANQAFAYAKNDLMDLRVFDFFVSTIPQALASDDEVENWKPMDCAQFIWALARLDLRYPDILPEFDAYIGNRRGTFGHRALDIIFTSMRHLEFRPQHLIDEYTEFELKKGTRQDLAGPEEVLADDTVCWS